MKEFFEMTWLDNPIKNYLIVLGVIFFILIFKRFISRYFAGLIFRLVKRIWKDVDKVSFIKLVVNPLGMFLLILVSIISIHKLSFPKEGEIPGRTYAENNIATFLNTDLYGYSIKNILYCIATIIIIV
jgi:MscS family membrane protein